MTAPISQVLRGQSLLAGCDRQKSPLDGGLGKRRARLSRGLDTMPPLRSPNLKLKLQSPERG